MNEQLSLWEKKHKFKKCSDSFVVFLISVSLFNRTSFIHFS